MIIRFSTAYDKATNSENNNGEIRTLGPNGLLELLEQELGFFDFYPSKQKRLQAFRAILDDFKNDFFYKEAFEKNSFAVTETLLKYRDELVLIGWKYSMKEQPIRLSQLAKIEMLFQQTEYYVGESDRWCQLLCSLERLKQIELPFQIMVEDSIDCLPFHLRTILSVLSIVDNSLVPDTSEDSNLHRIVRQLDKNKKEDVLELVSDDKSFQIVEFSNRLFMEEVCAYLIEKEDLVVLKDASFFDMSVVSLGKNAAGSEQLKANPPVLQHFNCIAGFLEKIPRLESILTFLQLSEHPLPYKFRVQLMNCLKNEPGFDNEHWNKLVTDFLEDANQDYSNYSTKDRERLVRCFLTFNTNDEHLAKKCKVILSYLIQWSKNRMDSGLEPAMVEQFLKLIELCQEVEELIVEDLSIDEIQQIFQQVYSSSLYTSYVKQQSSVTRLDELSSIADKTEQDVYWIDCKVNDSIQYALSFLQEIELDYLKSQGLELYAINAFLKLHYLLEMRGLKNIKGKLKIFIVDGEEMHPILLKIKSLTPGNLLKKVTKRVTSIQEVKELESTILEEKYHDFSPVQLPTPQNYMQLEVLSKIKRREIESASSMSDFINYPFDWVLKRVGKLMPTPEFSMPDEFLHNGNIAHRVIELLFEKQKNIEPSRLNIDSDEVIKNVLDSVLFSQGIHYLSPENKAKRSAFTAKLIQSIQSLQTFIKMNRLRIIGCEQSFGVEEACFVEEALGRVTGFIDLVLEDLEGNPVIIDLKWTRSETKYKELIENEEAIQLAVYAAALKKRTTAKSGYYLLNQNKLITSVSFKGDNVVIIHPNFSLEIVLNKLKKTLLARNNELSEGKLEIGERVQLSDLSIMDYEGIILPNNKDRKTKKANSYTGYDLFKGLIQ